MRIFSIHLGTTIAIKSLHEKLGLRPVLKDPFVSECGKGKYVVVFKYGVVCFWNMEDGEINDYIRQISPFVKGIIENKPEDEVHVHPGRGANRVDAEGGIFLDSVNKETVALVSMALGRSLAFELFENEVEKILDDFSGVIDMFRKRSYFNFISARSLLKKVALAMEIKHSAVSKMALLDKPDFIWEDTALDKFYYEISGEYELEDRYDILKEKIAMLFENVEFILELISNRRSEILELIIIFLILIEILLYF